MATPVLLPKLGNTVESSIIVNWLKKPGDRVAQDEPLCEVETDKATMEIASPAAGTLLAVYFPVGADVPVLTTIALVGEPGEQAASGPPAGAAAQPAAQITPAAAAAQEAAVTVSQLAVSSLPAETRSASSPRARNLAASKGLDLVGVPGSGPEGRIIERDVQAALAARPRLTPLARSMVEKGNFVPPPQGTGAGGRITTRDLQSAQVEPAVPPPAAPVDGAETFERVPLTHMRRIIADRMLASLQSTAQLTLNASADARSIQAYRKRLKASPEGLGLREVTVNDLVLFVTSRTLLQFPDLNALFTDNALLRYRPVHLGFAVDTPRGLIVPVIRQANTLNLRQMSQEARRLTAACLEGKVSADELQGGTFTVTNLGSLGIESFTPVLNPPQVAILGVGNIQLKPVEVDGQVQFIPHLGLSLTINHQVVDGAPGARFLQALARNLAELELLLAL